MTLEVPGWLDEALTPWRVEAAALRRTGGLTLDLASERAQIPVLIETKSEGRRGPLAISILDARVSARLGGSFVRALASRLEQTPGLPEWLLRLRSLGQVLGSAKPYEDSDGDLGTLIQLWREWPEHDSDPTQQVAPLPEGARELELPRGARCALILHSFARGEVIEGLSLWDALPPPASSSDMGFVEHHVDALAFAVLGRRDNALSALSEAAKVATDTSAWLTIARAREQLEDSEGAIAAHEQVLALRGQPWDRLRIARVRGDFATGEEIPRPDPRAEASEQASFARQVVKVLYKAGRYDDALVVLSRALDETDAADPELALQAAHLHLWRLEGEQARARLASVSDANSDGRKELIEGALAVLDGRPAQGLERLSEGAAAAATGATRLELLMWRAEAHLALGQFDEATACVDEHIVRENSLLSYLFKLLTLARTESAVRFEDSFGAHTVLDGLVNDVLPSLCSTERIDAARKKPAEFAQIIRGLFDDLGGNRSPEPTWCRRVDGQPPHLERVHVRPSGREAAVTNLIRIRSETPEAVLKGFEEVQAEYPTSAHTCTYGAELFIWLGRYEEALASFDEADRRGVSRWGFVGRAAVYDILEEPDKSDHWSHEGSLRFAELKTATTPVYRGERRRRQERLAEAQQDLEDALEFKPRRIGARINLALVLRARGDMDGWSRETERLRSDAPSFMWEAGARAGQPIDEDMLERILKLMVGNRSSFLHTMIDETGLFRVVPNPKNWVGHARLCLAPGQHELARVIAARWGKEPPGGRPGLGGGAPKNQT